MGVLNSVVYMIKSIGLRTEPRGTPRGRAGGGKVVAAFNTKRAGRHV